MLIRLSQKNDVPAMSRVYVQTWQETYLGVVPYGYLYAMSAPELEQGFFSEQQSQQVISYVAEDAGGVIGFINGGYERQSDTIYNGEIYALSSVRLRFEQIQLDMSTSNFVFVINLCECL